MRPARQCKSVDVAECLRPAQGIVGFSDQAPVGPVERQVDEIGFVAHRDGVQHRVGLTSQIESCLEVVKTFGPATGHDPDDTGEGSGRNDVVGIGFGYRAKPFGGAQSLIEVAPLYCANAMAIRISALSAGGESI